GKHISEGLKGKKTSELTKIKMRKARLKFIENKNDRISSLINRTLLQIELLKEYRKTLISDAVTGKIDVRGFEP
ncbi:MAG: restriction endonuclease subunit S, partial [Acidobacteria bacterium]|nr:restriction endonuclease subunit S [Acidobacteriota bacterium]